jgi:hypothetical protein
MDVAARKTINPIRRLFIDVPFNVKLVNSKI